MFDALREKKSGKSDDTAKKEGKDQGSQAKSGSDAGATPADEINWPLPRSSKAMAGKTPDNSKQSVGQQMKRVAQAASEITGSQEAGPMETNREDQKLTIGPGIQLKGEITDCDTLRVEGHIEASAAARILEISDRGTYIGDAEIATADISGHFEGNLTVADRLIIRSTGRISGKIRYNAIEIESGGEISGDIQVTRTAQAAQATTEEAQPQSEEARPQQAVAAAG